ncbi:MAG TPA: ribonuclease Z [Chloroflexota bacterium]
MIDVALVGTGGMMPLPNRWLASVLVRYSRHLVLFDCGEGTQISLRALGWGIKNIDLILISHVHGDHVTGLPGLLLSQGNSGRSEPVHIVGPPGLGPVLDGLRAAAPYLPFEVHFRPLSSGDCFPLDDLTVSCVAAEHRVDCLAYRLDLPRLPRFLAARAQALGVPRDAWKRLQHGETIGDVRPADVLGPPRRGLSVGLVVDTRPTGAIADLVTGVNLLVCEGTFGSDDDQPRAVETRHMTFREAALLARQAGAERLVLTHFSPAVVDPQAFAASARDIFPETVVGHDHLSLSLRFPDD